VESRDRQSQNDGSISVPGYALYGKRRINSTPRMSNVIVTGGAGFIGSALVRRLVADGHDVLNIDKLTYAGDLRSIAECAGAANYRFLEEDIVNVQAMTRAFDAHRPVAVFHLAAESHVDRSIHDARSFIQTNLVGTSVLLEVALDFWRQRGPAQDFRFIHVSTDEVYGSLGREGSFTEDTKYDPRSPYSAAKAGSDHLVSAWFHTYDLPTIISNCSNNFGPYQHPEKFIPTVIRSVLSGNPIPVYGAGENVRDWLYVDDHVDGLIKAWEVGRPGEKYNFGGDCELANLQLAKHICEALSQQRPPQSGSYEDLVQFVADRPGHDFRYAVNSDKSKRALSWTRRHSFESALEATIQWYLMNPEWWEAKDDVSDALPDRAQALSP
jgi:dTDP-glucose 4,6-dehydratase